MRPLKLLQIESINRCNGNCVFCAVSYQKKRRSDMSMDLFKKIIDDAVDLEPREIMPFLNGEPFVDKTLIEKIQYINKTLPLTNVSLYTNGNLLNEEIQKELEKVNIRYINFSINVMSNKDRQKVMGLQLGDCLNNIIRFKKNNSKTNISASIIMNTSYISTTMIGHFRDFCKRNEIVPLFFLESNWAGKTRKAYTIGETCHRLKDHVSILADGKVNLCCQDIDGQVNFGNIENYSLKEIWLSKEREHYYQMNEQGRRNELFLCNQCTSV